MKKILIIEDDLFLRDLYIDILTTAGFAVESATDGLEALAALQQKPFDLVLLDIMLPRMDGLTILEKLSKLPAKEQINKNIVVLSNLSQDTAIAQAVSLGARGYIIKSDSTPDKVVAEIKRYLNEAENS